MASPEGLALERDGEQALQRDERLEPKWEGELEREKDEGLETEVEWGWPLEQERGEPDGPAEAGTEPQALRPPRPQGRALERLGVAQALG